MKKTNAKKTLYTSLIASILVSTTSTAAIPTIELLKAEPIEHHNFKSVAEDSLMQSFSIIEIDTSFTKTDAKFAEKKVLASKNKPTTLSKATIIAD